MLRSRFLRPLESAPRLAGPKGAGLYRALHLGLRIPETYFLPRSVFEDIVTSFPESPLEELPLPHELEHDLEWLIRHLGKLAVRSSFAAEDSEDGTRAGRYLSVVPVRDAGEAWNAIRRIWGSALGAGDRVGAVLVQAALAGSCGGVAFSRHPYQENLRLVEWSGDGPQRVVRGEADARQASWPRGHPLQVEALPQGLAEILEDALQRLESVLPNGVDLEWIWDGNLWVLQARAIAARPARRTLPAWIDVDAYQPNSGIELHALAEVHRRWSSKRLICRRVAARLRIPRSRSLYFEFSEAPPPDAVGQLMKELRTEIVEIATDRDTMIAIPRDLVGSELARLAIGTPRTVRIQEFIPNDVCGHAARLQDGRYYIEHVHGGFKGFDATEIEPTRLLVRADGTIEETGGETQTVTYTYTYEQGWTLAPLAAALQLTREHLADIIRLVDGLADEGAVSVDWLLWQGRIFAYDMARESSALSVPSVATTTISPGTATGQAWIIGDLSPLHTIYRRRVDVIADSRLIAARRSAGVRELVASWHHPIVIAEYPDPVLTLLIDYVQGYVFRRGSLLCHTALILREAGIPSVVWGGEISDGDWVQIHDGVVYTSREMAHPAKA